jgi:hypothetical protein
MYLETTKGVDLRYCLSTLVGFTSATNVTVAQQHSKLTIPFLLTNRLRTKSKDDPHLNYMLEIKKELETLILFTIVISVANIACSTDKAFYGTDGRGSTNSGIDAIANRLQAQQDAFRNAQGDAGKLREPDSIDFVRDQDGKVISATLDTPNVNDQGLGLLSCLSSLRGLTMTRHQIIDRLTPKGISALARLSNLSTLKIRCFGRLDSGVFEEICKLRSLRELDLLLSIPPQREYRSITNLTNLAVLKISYCTNFGDQELCLLTNLTTLRNLGLSYDGFSPERTNVLACLKDQLTNCVVRCQSATNGVTCVTK